MLTESFPKEKTFNTQQIFAYYLFGVISLVSILLLISFLLKNNWISLVPGFLEPTFIKYDWVGIIYFPLVLLLLLFPMYIFSSKYKWFSRRTSYYISNETLSITDNKRNIRIHIKDIKQIRCQIKAALFPMSSKRATKEQIYKYYQLSFQTSEKRYTFYSLPFQTEEPEFRNFIDDLKGVGLNFDIKIPFTWRIPQQK